MDKRLFLSFFIDCEASQPAVRDLDLGRRASVGFANQLERRGMKATFHVLPSDAEPHAATYRDLSTRGHEVGLHVHPAVDGHQEFLGVCGPDEQHDILAQAGDRFARALGFGPQTICIGYMSTNDHTYGVLYDLGYRHGTCSMPTRVLPECASVHAGAPLDVHYAHRYNRVLPGDLDFVNIPPTVDPDSRMWGGRHPLDLRIELVDAKNHWYTIDKAVRRQVAAGVPVKILRVITHNTYDYGNPTDFRSLTLAGVIDHCLSIAAAHGLDPVPATGDRIAAAYRAAVPPGGAAPDLRLDRRGHGGGSDEGAEEDTEA